MDILDRLLGHDAWTTRQMLERCRALTDDEVHRAFDVGHGSVHATLVHMIGNVRVWIDLMTGAPPAPDDDAWRGLSVDDLLARHEAAMADFAALARRVRDEGRLDELWVDALDDPPTAKSFGGAIAHVLTHDMHHRGELLQKLHRLGLRNLPEGDVLSWEEATRSADA
ncbi:MAG: DinB family protein [Chloroflexota bacterium]|nr:DinB family protein [Chloroflexota bacterium]